MLIIMAENFLKSIRKVFGIWFTIALYAISVSWGIVQIISNLVGMYAQFTEEL